MVTISKGIYRFNDIVNIPTTGNGWITQSINFKTTVNFSGSDILFTCSEIGTTHSSDSDLDIFYEITSAEPQIGISGMVYVYNNDDKWKYENANIITIETDQEVSEDFATWFNLNAKRVLKAGTYKFVDEPARQLGLEADFDYIFNYSIKENGIHNGQASCTNMTLGTNESHPFAIFATIDSLSNPDDQILFENSFGTSFPITMPIYSVYNNGETSFPKDLGGGVITLESDQYVAHDFATWFADNTVEIAEKFIIKKGKYRFNDVLTMWQDLSNVSSFINIPFTCTYNTIDETTFEVTEVTYYFNRFTVESHIENSVAYSYYNESDVYERGSFFYTQSKGWKTKYLGFTREEALSAYPEAIVDKASVVYGDSIQTITITEDTEVDETFATWFSENTVEIKQVLIQYKEKTIDVDLGKTATLHIGGKKLTSDIVIKAPVVTEYGAYEGDFNIIKREEE